jgi:hypothetical protein
VVGLLPLASGPACWGMAFPPFLMKQLYRCDSVVISLSLKRLLDTWDRNGSTSGLTPWQIDDDDDFLTDFTCSYYLGIITSYTLCRFAITFRNSSVYVITKYGLQMQQMDSNKSYGVLY